MQNNDVIEMQVRNKVSLTEYRNEVRKELDEILSYWMLNTHDVANGGFIGRIDENNVQHAEAPKGAVLNSRILWAFSAAYPITKKPEHLHLARVAFNYLNTQFIDKEFGGVYWSVDARGKPLDTKKQIYALAFAIYGCSAFYKISRSEAAKETAISLYRQIEEHSYDAVNGGYFEAFTRDWQSLDDQRLSAKDANEKKTMNTHLHVLEAYTALYYVWPDIGLKRQITNLLASFTDHIINPVSGHLNLFFDEQWGKKGNVVSFGHDIEAAWLLSEAAEATGNLSIVTAIETISQKIATATLDGLDEDGGLWYEYDSENNHFIKEKHWWVQAEAMVGFFHQWQLTHDTGYLVRSWRTWQYTKAFIKDAAYGEWLWGRNEWGEIMPGQDKTGIWKCPYHNSRACIKILSEIDDYMDQ